MNRIIRDPTERFWSHVDKNDSSGCWIWTAHCNYTGYGTFQANGVQVRAHRFVWELTFGLIPKGILVCHACDNPSCVNPGHLWLGTNQANMIDREKKGRANPNFSFLGRRHSEETKQRLASVTKSAWIQGKYNARTS